MHRPSIRPTLLCALLLAGCGTDSPTEPPATNDKVFPVALATVANAPANAVVTVAGTVRYRYETPLGFTTAGKIAAVRFEEGDAVKAGALLAELDTTSVRADLDSAKAELDRARAEYQRFGSLFDKGWITRGQLERAEANARAAEARVSAAGFASSTARIIAPSSGTILARTAEPGQVVMAGTQVLLLGEASGGLVLRAPVIDSDLTRLKPGMPAEVRIDALPQGSLSGTISEIDGRANPGTGAFEVTIALPADPALRSGMIGTARIVTAASGRAQGLAVPATAVFNIRADEGLVYVYDAKAGRARRRNVSIGALDDRALTITDGLKPGERVVAAGIEQLVDGAKVKPSASAPAGSR